MTRTQETSGATWTAFYDEVDEAYSIGWKKPVGRFVVATVECGFVGSVKQEQHARARLITAAPDLLAALKEMGDWVAAGLQASDGAWPDARCLQHTEEIAARARAAVDKAEGRS